MMALEDFMPTLKTKMEEISRIKQVHNYDELPGSIMAWPTMVLVPTFGMESNGNVNISHHQIQATLFVASQFLPEAYGMAVPYIELVRNKLLTNITLDGLVDHCLPAQSPERFYQGPGQVSYGDKSLIGIIFLIDVKERSNVTVSA